MKSAFVLGLLLAAAVEAADVSEPGARDAIAAATTEPQFLSPWVADVPDSPTIPTPTKFLGHIAGAPGELTRTKKIYAYFRALAAATPRVKVETIGTTEEGREIILAIVGDEKNLARLGALRADMAALADPRKTSEAEMERIVGASPPFYMLHGGLHASETGSPEMLMELAYRLAVSDAPNVREIRENVVVLINPVAEPDGRDREVDWFYRVLKGRTDFDALPPHSPPYWGAYVFHDNNRDGIQRKLALTRATQDAFLVWHPAVVHDLHESIPLLTIWTGTGPYNANVDPITAVEIQAFAMNEVTALTAFGMPGVWTWGFTEGWSQFYADSVATNHNAIGRGYETFGNATAETVERWLEPDRNKYAGKPVTETEWYRSLPAPKKPFRWSLRNNTNYMETGVLAALQYTARNSPDLLRNFWRRGRNAVEKGGAEPPYAVVLPEAQDDKARLAVLVNLLRAHGVEVARATAPFTVKEGTFPAGTFVVKLAQPYRGFAMDLLLPQKFPEKAEWTPYDDVSWELPASLGVEAKAIEDPAVKAVAGEPVTRDVAFPGRVSGRGPVFLLKDTGQEALLAARIRLAKYRVDAAEAAFSSGGTGFPAGSWIVTGEAGLAAALDGAAAELGLDFVSVPSVPDVRRHTLDLPRLGVLQTWSDTQSAGWVRMIFDEEKIPYTLVMDEDVKAGNLLSRFDVLLYPNTHDDLPRIAGGIDPKFSPLPYTKTSDFPSQGSPTSSPDITGGLTWKGVGNLEAFVRGGGLLVTLGGASVLPLDGGIARDIRHPRVKDLETPGSHLRARFKRIDHPLAYGYKEIVTILREKMPVYGVRRSDRERIVLFYGTKPDKDPAFAEDEEREKEREKDRANARGAPPPKDQKPDEPPLVVSGGIKGEKDLAGKPAILDIPTGKGRIVAFDFDPIHRSQQRATFRLVWNAILNWNDLPPRTGKP
ncbi:MAG: M14 family zinc carboxypeptidase [Thermoanaerobaculia bacterium]|jgi:hypothetical protein